MQSIQFDDTANETSHLKVGRIEWPTRLWPHHNPVFDNFAARKLVKKLSLAQVLSQGTRKDQSLGH